MTPVHRIPAGAKLLILAVAGTGLVAVDGWSWMAVALIMTLALYAVARQPRDRVMAQLRPLLWLLVPLFLAQGYMSSWPLAALTVLRITTLVLLAGLVTLTTRSEAMIEAIEKGLRPLARFGVDPAKVALAFSLALRFIPVIARQSADIRDAQRARGLGNNPLALALPLILRTLKMASDVADAIEARSCEDDGPEAAHSPASQHTSSRSRPSCIELDLPPKTSFTSPCSPR